MNKVEAGYNMKGPILVVLAAGMGSRYGGLKQMDKIGKNGEVLLDYSVFDAKRAGFQKVVFIIRHDIEKDFNDMVLSRIKGHIDCETACQELDSLIPPDVLEKSRSVNRTKPWGTTHALLCARDKIDAPFTVLNADDFYGREAFEAIGSYLASPGISEGAIVPYKLEQTLSPQGSVTRGVCVVDKGCLVSVDELKSIAKEGDRIYNTGDDGKKQSLAADTPVSMNFWGFPVSIFPKLQDYFDSFLKTSGDQPKSECYLPLAADWLIKNNYLSIKVLPADSQWFGVTYKEDREAAENRISDLIAREVYPASLWG
jgi:dTDP-glucose pyrophosphorylase